MFWITYSCKSHLCCQQWLHQGQMFILISMSQCRHIKQSPVRCCDLSSPLHLSFFFFTFCLSIFTSHIKPPPQESCTNPLSVTPAWWTKETEMKDKWNNTGRSRISARMSLQLALSNDPDSVVPGRDSESSHEEEAVGKRLREGLGSDKVERLQTAIWWGGYGWQRRGGGVLTQFLSLSQWTGMLGWRTNPKNPSNCKEHTHTDSLPTPHALWTGAHFITSSWSHCQSTPRHLQSSHLSLSHSQTPKMCVLGGGLVIDTEVLWYTEYRKAESFRAEWH